MRSFTNSFLLFFYQTALGGLFGLSATPFHELERAFYKSTAGVLFVIGALALWGKANLYWQSHAAEWSFGPLAEISFYSLFVILFAAYVISLWGENQEFRARSFAACWLCGLVGLIFSARGFYDAPFGSVETFLYPLGFFLSALLLGTVTVGMLIGHWYLIDTGQSLDPFVRVYKFFVVTLVAQTLFLIVSAAALYNFGASASVMSLERLWQDHSTLLLTRVISGQAAPLVLSWMIWRTLLIPHTMAATGLFYIALLGVFVGEILGKQILALTSLPF
ncbi:MAG TPA: hypothetical protein VLD83_10765 [Candidatus Binatia bacterium]|nr:hypothetical protein [Candidatus Binatia bacterium]